MDHGELEENKGGIEKIPQLRGGLPKHFRLMKGDLEKKNLFLNLLFHRIILIKEINILEYLVLI